MGFSSACHRCAASHSGCRLVRIRVRVTARVGARVRVGVGVGGRVREQVVTPPLDRVEALVAHDLTRRVGEGHLG